MSKPHYSFIIPVFNRPEEIEELLNSFHNLKGTIPYEILIIEDGSEIPCESIVQAFEAKLNIKYFYKSNSGPGSSRNFGMSKATSDFFIILDSDVLLDSDYLTEVHAFLSKNKIDCYGGPDGADQSFNDLQKAINFSMTSIWTTGGIRGHKAQKKFQPRSFNMGLSRKAFEATKGFGSIHPGEDPDLVLRLWDKGFKTAYIDKAVVYHKRRINWRLFFTQVFKFGSVRPILNKWHPQYNRLLFWFPSLFLLGFVLSLMMLLMEQPYLFYVYISYGVMVLLSALIASRSIKIAVLSVLAVCIQFAGYGIGYLRSFFMLKLNPHTPEKKLFPNLFFE